MVRNIATKENKTSKGVLFCKQVQTADCTGQHTARNKESMTFNWTVLVACLSPTVPGLENNSVLTLHNTEALDINNCGKHG